MYVLGISAFYHDSAAALLKDGDILAAAQEERFTRVKGDASLPRCSIDSCLKTAGIQIRDVDHIVFYESPQKKLSRLLGTYTAFAPRGYASYARAMRSFLGKKIRISSLIQDALNYDREISVVPHHLSHAASAFYPSPFEEAAILTMDGVGEWATTSIGIGNGNQIQLLKELRFPHSVGMLYSAFTYYAGFKVNSGEYKLMGLAPYGEAKYVEEILTELIDLKDDGSFRMNMKYFDYCTGFTMTSSAFHDLFQGPPREPESLLTQKEMDLAKSVQVVLEEIFIRLARTTRSLTGMKNLCLAGGVALNCVANGKLLRERIFEDLWIQPAAGDAGGALGSALHVWYASLNNRRKPNPKSDSQKGSYLGPQFSSDEIEKYLEENEIPHTRSSKGELARQLAVLMADQKVIGLFHGRMEFGPRALGNRSIIGDPRDPEMQSVMNLKIKFRESFRPFAPAVLRDRVSDYFDFPADRQSPYMLLVADVKPALRRSTQGHEEGLWGIEKLKVKRSEIPAVTHVDYSARVQTVSSDVNPFFYGIISEFEKLTGCPVVVNTSFNVRGEPIVCTYQDAYRCFMRTHIDYLVLEDCLLDKRAQKPLANDEDWRKQFQLD
jgi:carbamoyltransferase